MPRRAKKKRSCSGAEERKEKESTESRHPEPADPKGKAKPEKALRAKRGRDAKQTCARKGAALLRALPSPKGMQARGGCFPCSPSLSSPPQQVRFRSPWLLRPPLGLPSEVAVRERALPLPPPSWGKEGSDHEPNPKRHKHYN